MSCERYWREGVLLVEQGVTDLHRESCETCQRAHAGRAALVAALPLVGAEDAGRADWKQRVWAQIDRLEARRSRRPWMIAGFAFAAVAAIAWIVVFTRGEQVPAPERYATTITIEKGPIKKRGGAQVGDRVRAQLDTTDEVRIYRVAELVFQCGAATPTSPACVRDARGRIAHFELPVPGEYMIVIVSGNVASVGDLDGDLAALVEANVRYRIEQELSVR